MIENLECFTYLDSLLAETIAPLQFASIVSDLEMNFKIDEVEATEIVLCWFETLDERKILT